MNDRPLVVRLYGWMVGLLPPDTRAYRHDMEAAFAEQWRSAPGPAKRTAVLVRSVGRLPALLAVEWLEYLGARRAPGRNETTGGGGMGMLRDLRFAVRSLRKAPAFALSTTALVAVGVGAVTTIFTLVDHVLLRPLPYPDQDRMVYLGNPSHSGPFFESLARVGAGDAWAGAWTTQATVDIGGEPLLLEVAQVTDGFLEFFGAGAVRGRLLDSSDFAAGDVVVVSGTAWRTLWGADPDLVGRTVRVDGQPAVVAGVVDPSFQLPEAVVGGDVHLWRPVDWTAEPMQHTNFSVLNIAGRTRPGVGLPAVQDGVDRLLESLAATDRNFVNREGEIREVPVSTLADATVSDVRRGLNLLLAAVAVLLLVACANVAHLFLARGLERVREMAVRRAMGAGGGTVVRHLLAESLVVGAVGGLGGAALAAAGLRAFLSLNPEALPRGAAVTLDLRVLGFALGISALTAVVFGMVPALRSVRGELAEQLHAGGRGSTGGRGINGLRRVLVSAEVALSLVLIAGAGLLVRSFVSVRAQETGFRVEDVWTVPLRPTDVESPEQYVALASEVERALRGVPGVQDVAVALTMPMEYAAGGRCCWGSRATVEGVELADTRVNMHPVSSGFVPTLGIEVLSGRVWTPGEATATPTPVVLNEPLAIEAFGSAAAAAGRPLAVGDMQMTVVGVVTDTRHYGLEHEHGAALYLPIEQVPFPIPRMHAAVHLAPGAGRGTPGALREAVWSVAPGLPVPTVRTMEDWIARSTAARRFQSSVFGAFAAVGLLLAAGGLYGTLLFMAGQRRRELGIRLALGASRQRIERKLLMSGLSLTGVGIVLGLAGAWFSGRLLESWIWGVERGDPATLVAASGVLLLTAAVASWLPARKAGRTDPLEALRAE
ncbi:MAG: ADOP family duplicated permease [Longimicrobiales bacterium]